MNTFADIVLPLPLDRAFTYLVPPSLQDHVRVGSLVLVPFGRKTLVGVVVDFPEKRSVRSLKSIQDILDPSPLFPTAEDSTVVARLRRAGALLVGKANMHEIGINVFGLNPINGTTRNPYNPNHFTGGSSSGPATAVAAGLVPVAIGADGGVSIRIPSSFCGLVGLKATHGRISEFGAYPIDWSIAHIGPMAGSASDVALTYALISGPDPKDPTSLHQPLPSLQGWDNLDLKGLKLGVYWQWFRHADAEVVAACEAMLREYEKMGCEIVEVIIPNLEANRIAHRVTILSEMAQAMNATYQEHLACGS